MRTGSLRVLKMQSLRHWKDNSFIRYALLAVLALAAAVSVYQGARNALEYSQDFQWDAAKALAMGLDPYELSYLPEIDDTVSPELAAFYRMFTDRGLTQTMEANQFPSLLLLLFPMTIFAPQTAKIIWLVFNLAFTAGIIIMLRRTFFEDAGIYEYALIVLLMLAGTPYRNQLGVGQHTLFAFFFFMLAVCTDRYDRDGSVSNSLLIAGSLAVSYFKYTLTGVLALYFLYRKRYKELAMSIAVHVVLTGVFAAIFDKSFLYMIKAPLEVASRLAAEGGIDLGVILKSPFSYAAAFIIVILLVVITVIMPKDRECIIFALLVFWSLILTYHRTYDFFVLSAASAMFLDKGADADRYRPAGTAAYMTVIICVYFVLRIFNENTVSRICVGILYYAFTIALTYMAVSGVRKERCGVGQNG